MDADNLDKTTQVLLTEMGRSACYPDGLLVVGDRVRVLQRINSMLDQIEAAESNTWIMQLYLISVQDTFTRELGVETKTALDLAATFAGSGGGSSTAQGAFTALLKASRSNNKASVVASPLMLLLDGGTSRFQDGETVPIPRRTTTESGAVVTNGYEYAQTGLIVETSIREMSSTTAQCSLAIELTAVTGYVEEAPITSGQKFETKAVLESNGVYLLGAMPRKQKQDGKSGSFFPTLAKVEETTGDVQVWVRCFRIDGPVRNQPAPSVE